MVIEKKELVCMDYPVGLFIQPNLGIIKEYIRIIKEDFPDKDIDLICTGSSGAIIAGIIASKVKCRIIYVTKDGERSHSSHGHRPSSDAHTIVVDDIISTGKTIKRILDAYRGIRFNCLIVSGSIDFNDCLFSKDDFDYIYCHHI